MFNEYVYLSDDKLQQFVPSERSWWSRIRAKKFGGKASVGGVEVSLEFEPSEAGLSTARLEKIHDHIGERGRWFEESGLTTGEWVFFEGRIGLQPLDNGAVLFCQAGELTSPANRIVLHGSASNLVGIGDRRTAAASGQERDAPAGGFSSQGSAASVLEAAVGRTEALQTAERVFWRRFTDSGANKAFAGQESLPSHMRTLFEKVASADWYLDDAPFLVGCARITAMVRPSELPFTVVVASPLFVRYARP